MKKWAITFGLFLMPLCMSHGALVVNGDMSSNSYATGGNNATFVDLDQGWAVKSQANLDYDTNPGKMTWDGPTDILLEDSLAQINSVTTETGSVLTLAFEWTPAAGASSTNTSLDYQVVGWQTNGISAPVATDIFFNNINSDTKKVSGLSTKANVIDLLNGTNHGTESPTPGFGTITGSAGATTNAVVAINLSGYGTGLNDVGDYDYIGVRFSIGGDQIDLSATGSTLDNVQLTTSNVTNIPDPTASFFNDTISLVSSNVDLVADYGASGSDTTDDSVALQTAIDDMTLLPNGGKITIPSGTFYLVGILLKSNVHIEIDPGTTIRTATPAANGTIFAFGLSGSGADALVTISNISIRASSGRFTVDISDVAPNPTYKVAVVNCKNADNFMIADCNIIENHTRLSSFTFNLAEDGGQYFRPRNGLVKNADNLYGHYGYGMIQVQCGYNIMFTNLTGTGGVTLRLESGANDVAAAPQSINIDQIYARNISITNGHYALMMGPHTRENGHVDADGIYAVGSLMAASCGRGFATAEEIALGQTPGFFAGSSIVRNVHAVYGSSGAQFKGKNMDDVPCQLRHLISTNAFPYDTAGEIYPGPSAAAARNSDPDITFSNVTHSGFVYQPKALLSGEPWEDLDADLANLYVGCNPVPVDGVTISQTNLSLNVTKSAALGATVSPVNATDTNVNWISDNPAVAIVSESGLVTALNAGTANITARTVDWGWFDTCALTVSGGGGGSWTQLSSNDFELGWGDWESGNTNDVFLSTNNAIGAQCVNLQDDTATAYMALSSALDLTPYTRLKLEFSLYSVKMNYSHELVLEYSDDGGSSWATADNCLYGFEFDNTERVEISLIIDDVSQNLTNNMKVRIRCNAGFDGDDAYIDNVVISAFARSGWGEFVADYDLSAVSTNDSDNDGQSDIYEYALGGNPTNDAVKGALPTLAYGTNDMVSFYNWQVNASNPGISYMAEWTDNLVTGIWSSAWDSTSSTATTNSAYNESERQVYGGTTDNLFFRLKISQP